MPAVDHNPHKRRLYLPIVQTQPPEGRRPDWLRVKARTGPNYSELKDLMRSQGLHTVCEEAVCPNIYECW
ncbi:MAG TPA: hypothetical protein VKA30_08770, partial [Actinomycetota bacterium]|nr:hypothetical protein [Actinomycetota bacterium]